MALYPPAIKKLLPESSSQSRIRPVLIVLHTNASTQTLESVYNYWLGANTEAHFQIGIGGRLGQYIDTETRADSNSAANSFTQNGQLCGAISIETSDLGNHGDPGYQKSWIDLNERQALEDAVVWCCQTHGIEPRLAYPYPGGGWRGIGYHAQVSAWSNAAHICPGPGKIREVPDLIAAVARRLQGDEPMTPEDKAYLDAKFAAVTTAVGAVDEAVWNTPILVAGQTTPTPARQIAGYSLRNTADTFEGDSPWAKKVNVDLAAIDGKINAVSNTLASALPGLSDMVKTAVEEALADVTIPVDNEAVATAVADKLAARLVA